MSKLVIWTQIRENYGAHDWSGEGECPQYWKFKGGNTYVVRDLSTKSLNTISQDGIPTLTKLIEDFNEAWEEYILGWEVVEDSAKECEDWDSVTEFRYENGAWMSYCYTTNDEHGWMRREILAKSESWRALPGGERADYKCEYKTESGWLTEDQLREYLQRVDG